MRSTNRDLNVAALLLPNHDALPIQTTPFPALFRFEHFSVSHTHDTRLLPRLSRHENRHAKTNFITLLEKPLRLSYVVFLVDVVESLPHMYPCI